MNKSKILRQRINYKLKPLLNPRIYGQRPECCGQACVLFAKSLLTQNIYQKKETFCKEHSKIQDIIKKNKFGPSLIPYEAFALCCKYYELRTSIFLLDLPHS